MLIAKISVTGVHATSTKLGTLTSGMVGARVQFTFDSSSWEGLSKTAVFRCMDITKDVLNIDSEVTIPHEVLVRSGSPLYAGVYGTNADGDLVIPTRWATVGIVYSGADPSGDPSTERSPDVWEQLQNQINELKQQGADADAIKQAVEAYMAANPPAESDPTVPEWAKQPQKPTYTAAEVGALASNKLQNAVNVALAKAKESGSFDGKDGYTPQKGIDYFDGEDGQPGADGKDYVLTDADRAEIAEQAAGMVEVPDVEIPTTLPNPHKLTFTGAVQAEYDGSEAVSVEIPEGGGGGSTEWKKLTITLDEDVNKITFDVPSAKRVFMVSYIHLNDADNSLTTQTDFVGYSINGNWACRQLCYLRQTGFYAVLDVEKIGSHVKTMKTDCFGNNISFAADGQVHIAGWESTTKDTSTTINTIKVGALTANRLLKADSKFEVYYQ